RGAKSPKLFARGRHFFFSFFIDRKFKRGVIWYNSGLRICIKLSLHHSQREMIQMILTVCRQANESRGSEPVGERNPSNFFFSGNVSSIKLPGVVILMILTFEPCENYFSDFVSKFLIPVP